MEDNDYVESSAPTTGVEHAQQVLAAAQDKGAFAKLGAFVKLSGPG